MTITTEELARIRAIAEADKEGADGKAWDEAITPDTVIALCRELELARKHAVTMSEVAAAAWGGEIPSPLPGHTHMTEEEFSESYNCPWCGGSGHIDDCDEADKQVKDQLERLEREADWLAHGYTNAVDLLGMCPRNIDMSKCQESSCMECMRESARKAVEGGR